jgi:broad specificity phosphatase PhoE
LVQYRSFPNAETFEEVYNKVSPVIHEIINNKYENIIIVGHGLALVMFLLQWLKMPVGCLENIAFEASSGGVSFYSIWENKRMLNKYNITSYMNTTNNNEL